MIPNEIYIKVIFDFFLTPARLDLVSALTWPGSCVSGTFY